MKKKCTIPNILITGANGQLGSSLALLCNFKDANFFFTDVAELDVTSKGAVEKFIAEKEIDLVINCAAYTNVEKAEDESKKAERLNACAPKYLAESCKRHNAILIHISTDYVFGNRKRKVPITERSKPSPLNVYGATKLQGEENIKASGCNYIIIRTSWLFSEYGNNFVKTMLQLLSTREEIKVVDDQIGTPTYAGDLAKAVYKISFKLLRDSSILQQHGETENCNSKEKSDKCRVKKESSHFGTIYNYSNLGECSWYEFATKIQQLSKVKVKATNKKCHIIPCTSKEYPTKARRPKYSLLSKEKIQRQFSLSIPTWQHSLAESLRRCRKMNKTNY